MADRATIPDGLLGPCQGLLLPTIPLTSIEPNLIHWDNNNDTGDLFKHCLLQTLCFLPDQYNSFVWLNSIGTHQQQDKINLPLVPAPAPATSPDQPDQIQFSPNPPTGISLPLKLEPYQTPIQKLANATEEWSAKQAPIPKLSNSTEIPIQKLHNSSEEWSANPTQIQKLHNSTEEWSALQNVSVHLTPFHIFNPTQFYLPPSQSTRIGIGDQSQNRFKYNEILAMKKDRKKCTRVYRCKQCDYAAKSKDEYWYHCRIHIKLHKILSCPKCPFVTEHKHHLEYHLRNHFGSKPFKCSKCPYTCINNAMLKSHMKSHTNHCEFKCADCNYATKYCHSLKIHLKKHSHKAENEKLEI